MLPLLKIKKLDIFSNEFMISMITSFLEISVRPVMENLRNEKGSMF